MTASINPLAKRRTKIVCTLGPATNTPEKIRALIMAGMDLVRINCSHGEPEDRIELTRLVREAAKELKIEIPIMFDLQGPKIRIGRLEENISLKKGDRLIISSGDAIGRAGHVTTTYPYFARDVAVGEKVLIDDGRLCLNVDSLEENEVHTTVEVGGLLKPRKGINLPNTTISAPCLTEKDLADLKLAVDLQVDFAAVSFVRNAQDMTVVRKAADELGEHHLQFISKIERPEALKDLLGIIRNSDGVMVARGDLGVEVGSPRVPMIQKEIITRSNMGGKFVITATQMLDSMIDAPVPTRAEASDVANAILDGTDACMLSGETAAGSYPIRTVKTMVQIAQETESHPVYRYQSPTLPRGSIHHIPDGISAAAHETANLMGAQLLVAFTNSGNSALKLSKRHPASLLVGATIHEHIARRMRVYWGVIPLLIRKPSSVEEMFEEVKQRIMDLELVRKGDVAILTSGFPLWTSGSTNLMRVMEIE
ncbi:MAG: pyruvate kinase [Acidobacteriota bacterium]|nr:pyruvate kinase [Acidobacteriota bacterium]